MSTTKEPIPSSPTPVEVKAARDAAGLTQKAAAAVVYTKLNAWQRWESGDREMHPAFFEFFKIKTGKIDAES